MTGVLAAVIKKRVGIKKREERRGHAGTRRDTGLQICSSIEG